MVHLFQIAIPKIFSCSFEITVASLLYVIIMIREVASKGGLRVVTLVAEPWANLQTSHSVNPLDAHSPQQLDRILINADFLHLHWEQDLGTNSLVYNTATGRGSFSGVLSQCPRCLNAKRRGLCTTLSTASL